MRDQTAQKHTFVCGRAQHEQSHQHHCPRVELTHWITLEALRPSHLQPFNTRRAIHMIRTVFMLAWWNICPYEHVKVCAAVLHTWQLSTVGNHDVIGGVSRPGTHCLNRLHNVVTLHHLSEHTVLAIQPGGGCRAEEELTAVGVGTCDKANQHRFRLWR